MRQKSRRKTPPPVRRAVTASFNPSAATKVNAANVKRGPLLLISGLGDHTVPPVQVKSVLKVYRASPAVTKYKEFPGRGHSLTIDHGWQEIAGYCLTWIQSRPLSWRLA